MKRNYQREGNARNYDRHGGDPTPFLGRLSQDRPGRGWRMPVDFNTTVLGHACRALSSLCVPCITVCGVWLLKEPAVRSFVEGELQITSVEARKL